mgnify:CR=1 FL=1|jgi:hypothetical protein
MDILEEGRIRRELRDIKEQVRTAVLNRDPETAINLIRKIQELDHLLYDNEHDGY